MDHKIIKSRKQKYPTSSLPDLRSSLIDEETSIGDRSSTTVMPSSTPTGPLGYDRGDELERADSITTMRSDINQPMNDQAPLSPGTSSYFERTNTRTDSFYDYIITPYEYFLFCLGFSIATVPVVVALSFSATVLPHIGVSGLGNGGFFLGYALCSLSFSKSVVDTMGCKFAIFWGFIGSSIFVLSFLITSVLFRDYIDIVYPIGATIGGVSQAVMWTAQVRISSIPLLHLLLGKIFHSCCPYASFFHV